MVSENLRISFNSTKEYLQITFMKIKLFSVISFFTFFLSNAQIQNGKIDYGVVIEMIEGFKGGY